MSTPEVAPTADTSMPSFHSTENGRGKPENLTSPVSEMPTTIAERLFRQLELGDLISDFFLIAEEQLTFSSIEFQHVSTDFSLSMGKTEQHRLNYEIEVSKQLLGSITVTRNKHFSQQEIHKLETLLAHLGYPLRNAALYNHALQSAHSDPLTGVNNRAAMEAEIPREIQLAQRRNEPLSLLMIDTDHFKQINDQFGHLVGDQALQKLAEVFNNCVRNTDLIFRYGGDEFIIALPDTGNKGGAEVAERIRHSVAQCHFTDNSEAVALSVSIGMTQINALDTLKTALDRADKALYEAKNNGRNQVFCSND